jgi:uncharacterized protein YggE
MFSVCLAATVAPVFAQTTTPPTPSVMASGEHRIKVAPDQAWATVAVETRDAKAPEARRLGATAMTTVTAALRRAGLDSDAIQTVGYSLHPDYEYTGGRQRMKGFIVSNQVQVRIDDIAKVADVLDAVGSLSLPSSSTVNISGLRFDLKNRAGVERDALRGAVADAMARAKAMAAGAGMSVVRILRIDEGINAAVPKYGPEPMMMQRSGVADAAMPTPISPADIEIRAYVTMTAEIK